MSGKHVRREAVDFDDQRDVPSGPYAVLTFYDGNTGVAVGFGVWDAREEAGSRVVYRSQRRSDCMKYIEGKLQREVFR